MRYARANAFARKMMLALCVAALCDTPRALRAQPARPGEARDALLQQALIDAKVPATAPADPATAPRPLSLRRDEPAWINSTAESRAIRCSVHSATLRNAYGPARARDAESLLILDVEIENIIPLTLISEKKVPTEYRVPNLADHLYVLIDGRRVARIRADAGDLPGHIATSDFKLAQVGDSVRGNVVFDAGPTTEATTAELRFYDYAHGHFNLELAGADETFAAQERAKPLAAPSKNEVLDVALFGIERKDEVAGAKAPQGMTYVIADLRARSMFTFPGDATAFDPKAKPGQKMQIGTVADWTDADRYLQLVVDGDRAYSATRPATTLPEQPRFLPDVMTGGQVVFLAPREAKSLEVRCDFPNAKKPDGQVIRPKGMTLAAEGERPALAAAKPIASVDDDVYKVAVTGQRIADAIGEAKPADGEKFLVLDVTVQNVGQQDELFQTREQLKCATADGKQREVDPATYQGVYRPTEVVFIPAGERRRFEVAYAIPANETRPRLAYGGVSLAKMLDLPAVDGAPVAANAPNAATPANVPAPQNPAGADKPAAAENPVAADKPAPAKQQVAVATPVKPPAAQKPVVKAINKLEVPRVPAKQPLEPRGLAGVGLKPEQVNQAIDRGAAFLWDYIKQNDLRSSSYAFGYRQEHMLAALALVHAQAHKKFPEFDADLRRFIAEFDPLRSSNTYVNGLYCMLVQSYGDPTYLPKLRQTAQWLVDQQGPDGTWGYGIAQKKQEAAEVPIRRVLQVAGGRPVDEPAGGEPIVRKTKWEQGADGDNSVTQYALLGLHAASRFEVSIPRETWERVLKETRKRQDKAVGGFGYTSPAPGSNYGSMTAAGACALALARHELGEKEPANDPDVERALAWLSEYFTVAGNPHPEWSKPDAMGGEWHYYYLYSLERVGRIMDTEFIGPHEWYPLGAKLLLAAQRSEDGGWLSKEDRNDPVLSTSFALLFLTRATESLHLPKREGPGTLKTAVAMPPAMKIHVILDCSGSMLEEMEGRPKFDIAREAVMALVDALPEQAQFGLRVYGHRKRATEDGASDDTELLVPIGGVKRDVLREKLQNLRARGKTPMARSLLDAMREVRGGSKDNPIIVILLTDGGEDSQPRRDPLKAAEEFGKLEGVRLHIVGFDINRPDWLEQLLGMAERAHGQFLPAQKSAQLQRELKSAVFGTPEGFAIFSADGKPAGTGNFGDRVPLPEGKYTFRTEFAGKQFESPFWVNAGATTAITFDAAAVANEMKAAKDAAPAQAPPAVADKPAEQAPAGATPTMPEKDFKFCTSCGTKIARNAKFCTSCGAKQ